MKADALWITGKRKVEIIPVEIKEPGYGEVQVEIKACGICAGDSFPFQGISVSQDYPFQFGHEGVGVITKVGPGVTAFKPGDKVFAAGGGNMMAQVVNLPIANLGHIPDDVEDFSRWIGEPVTCVLNGIEQINITPGDHIVVIGTGYMGLLSVQGLAKTLAGKITAFDVDEKRLELAKEYGADEVYVVNSNGFKEINEEIKAGGGCDIVIEASGSAAGLQQANDILKRAGVLSLFAWHRAIRNFDGTRWHLGGFKVLNTSPMIDDNYLDRVRQTAILMEKGVFNQDKLVTHVGDYHRAQELLKISVDKTDGYIKGVITF